MWALQLLYSVQWVYTQHTMLFTLKENSHQHILQATQFVTRNTFTYCNTVFNNAKGIGTVSFRCTWVYSWPENWKHIMYCELEIEISWTWDWNISSIRASEGLTLSNIMAYGGQFPAGKRSFKAKGRSNWQSFQRKIRSSKLACYAFTTTTLHGTTVIFLLNFSAELNSKK